jgi:hypothetical protein
MTQLRASGEARRRKVGKARIVDLMLFHGWAFEMRAGAALGG